MSLKKQAIFALILGLFMPLSLLSMSNGTHPSMKTILEVDELLTDINLPDGQFDSKTLKRPQKLFAATDNQELELMGLSDSGISSRSNSSLQLKYPLQRSISAPSVPAINQMPSFPLYHSISPDLVKAIGGEDSLKIILSRTKVPLFNNSPVSFSADMEYISPDSSTNVLQIKQSNIRQTMHSFDEIKSGRVVNYDGLCIFSAWGNYKKFIPGTSFVGTDLSPHSSNKKLKSNFSSSKCEKSDFSSAIMPGISFFITKLKECKFNNATLTKANFMGADLESADFTGADVEGADFKGANLIYADFTNTQNLDKALFDKKTILPNGKKWDSSVKIIKNR